MSAMVACSNGQRAVITNGEQEVESLSTAWLAMLDAQDHVKSYNMLSEIFKSEYSYDEWVESLTDERKFGGVVVSRSVSKLDVWGSQTEKSAVVDCLTTVKGSHPIVETVHMELISGKWLVAAYGYQQGETE